MTQSVRKILDMHGEQLYHVTNCTLIYPTFTQLNSVQPSKYLPSYILKPVVIIYATCCNGEKLRILLQEYWFRNSKNKYRFIFSPQKC